MIDEILVHISTPATRQNDELYHSLANAYLEFEPQRVLHSQPGQGRDGSEKPAESEINCTMAPTRHISSQAGVDTSLLSTSKDSYGSFPSCISSEGQEKINEQAGTQQYGSSESTSLPPSSRLAQLDRIQTKWKQQNPPKPRYVKGQGQNRQLPIESDDADTGFIEDTQLAVQALQSQLQDTYSTTSEDTSEDESESELPFENHCSPVLQSYQQSNDKSTQVVSEPGSPATSARSGTANTMYGKTARIDITERILRSTTRTTNIGNAFLDGPKAVPDLVSFATVPIDAYPPEPEMSVAASGTLPSQVTNYLASIKSQNPNRFKPSKKSNSPKSDDRGYWMIKCSKWPIELQFEFWTALHDHVASGRLGWGTTLHRESASPRTMGLVKLYCWGEVIEHMWLVLWLCSKGKVAGSGARWIDADGIAALEVP